jgi:hypothetical protein
MALGETVILSVLPNGWKGGNSASDILQVSVVVSLQASPPPPPAPPTMLASALPLLRAWADPAHWTGPNAARFTLALSGGPGMAVTEVPAQRIGPAPDAPLWAALFPADHTPLAAFPPPEPLPSDIRTYGGAKIASFARDKYSDPDMLGAAPASHSEHIWLTHPTRFLPFIDQHLTMQGRARLQALLAPTTLSPGHPTLVMPGPPAPPAPGRTAPATPALASDPAVAESNRAIAFVKRPAGPSGPQWQPFDFHDMLAALGHYHALMRRLGLVFDLEAKLPPGSLPQAVQVMLNVFFSADGDLPHFVAPTTLCRLDATQFVAAPRGIMLASGLRELKLGGRDTPFVLSEVDALAAAIRFDALGHRAAQILNAADAADLKTTLPSLRTGGISLFRAEADQHVANVRAQVDNAVKLHQAKVQPSTAGGNPGLDVPLAAEDLVRGYLLDILDPASGQWRSVSRRSGTLHVASAPALSLQFDDEGCTGEALARVATLPNTAFMENAVLRWAGWSLIVPMPLGTAETEPGVEATDRLASGIKAELTVPNGSLPRLRFGQSYRFRVRTMDIAGNSLPQPGPATKITDEAASPPITYGRLEPVPPPVVALKTLPGPGESLSTTVVRSNGTNIDGLPPAERHLLPPVGAIFMLERHGVFDDTSNPHFKTPAETYKLLTRAGQSLWSQPDAVTTAKADIHRAQLQPQDVVTVPYLPDVMAQKVVVRVVEGLEWFDKAKPPGIETESFLTGQGSWPDTVRSVGLRVIPVKEGDHALLRSTERNGIPAFEVFLPPGAVVKLRMSVAPNEARLPQMKVFQWLRERLGSSDPARLAILTDSILRGDVPVITPWEDITTRHAVSAPLRVPTASLAAVRSPGPPTAISIKGPVSVDLPSTDHVTFYAEWIDFTDAPGAPPALHTMRAVLGTLTVDTTPRVMPIDDVIVGPSVEYTLHMRDAAARVLALSSVASPRFRGDFAQADTRFPFGDFVLSVGGEKLAPAMPLGSPQAQAIEQAWRAYLAVNGGKAWHLDRALGGSAPPPHVQPVPIVPVQSGPDGLVSHVSIGAPVIEIVPSAAAPPAPLIDQVVPSLVRSRQDGQRDGVRTTTWQRYGNRLRVWLARPFHGSGYPEELAVVLPEHAGQVPPALEKVVTLWGADLASGTSGVTQLDLGFPLAHPTPQPAYPLPGLPGSPVRARIAPHPVAYDSASDRYYCDIVVTGFEAAYMPFVQLALATFQRAALPGHELSHVVMAGTVQLLPDRKASLDIAVNHGLSIIVTGPVAQPMLDIAETNSSIEGILPNVVAGYTTLVTAQVECRPAGSVDDLAWEAQSKRPISLALPAPFPTPPLPGPNLRIVAWAQAIPRDPSAPSGKEWRLTVREYEYAAEGSTAGRRPEPVATRLVFAEHFELPEWGSPAPKR